jgi:hypothetical protein
MELWSLFKDKEKLQNYKQIFLEEYIFLTGDNDIVNYLSYMYKLK